MLQMMSQKLDWSLNVNAPYFIGLPAPLTPAPIPGLRCRLLAILMFVAYSYFFYIIPVPVAIPNTSWLACEVCAEAKFP